MPLRDDAAMAMRAADTPAALRRYITSERITYLTPFVQGVPECSSLWSKRKTLPLAGRTSTARSSGSAERAEPRASALKAVVEVA
jgi:hypothetical protein